MKEFDCYFLYVGNAYPHKNLKILIEATLFLNKKRKENIELRIVSVRNIFTERLNRLVEKLNAQKYVKILGFVEDEKLRELYKNCKAFIFPSLSEGFGLPGVEAMKYGSLVCCSEIPVFKEIYKDVPFYFNPFDVNSISDSMKIALDIDPLTKERRVEKGIALANRYSWSKMAKETLSVYESCFGL